MKNDRRMIAYIIYIIFGAVLMVLGVLEVVDSFWSPAPVYQTVFFENLWSGSRLFIACKLALWSSVKVACYNMPHSVKCKCGAQCHKPVVYRTCVFVWPDFYAFAAYDVACVYVMVEEECGDTGLCVAVHHGTVYRSCSTVPGQQGRMEIECSRWRHGPDGFRKHTEGYDN